MITIKFSKTMASASIENAVTLSPAATISQFHWADDLKSVTLVFDPPLQAATEYVLTLSADITDVNNTPLDGNGDGVGGDDFTLQFYTLPSDLNGPVVVQSDPDIDNQTDNFPIDGVMTIVFNEALDPATVNNNTIQLFDDNGLMVTNYKLTSVREKAIVSVQTSSPLENDASYTLVFSSEISDTAGNTLESDISINFRTSDVYYQESIDIEKFMSLTNWEQPSYSGSTVGIVVPNTTFEMTGEAYLPSASSRQRNSARLRYEWAANASDYLIREYASGSGVKNVKFDTSYVLQCFVFGDGSKNKFRFSLREESGQGYPLEVSEWVTINWYGWKIIEWDLSDPNSVGTWLGNEILDGSQYYIDSFQLTHEDKESELIGKVFFDNLRIVKKASGSSAVKTEKPQLPNTLVLGQNYPNPFNPTTTISFSIPKKGLVQLMVFDVLGRHVATLINKNVESGNYQIPFNGSNLTSGIYIYRLRFNNKTYSRQMLLMK